MTCPLCLSSQTALFSDYRHAGVIRHYHICSRCHLIFMDPSRYLSAADEKARYDLHQNDLSDPRYKDYLLGFIDHLRPHLKLGMRGLDFGCGVVPGIADLMKREGYVMDHYDPYYFPSRHVLDQTYDFVACCEVAEHFCRPHQEFSLLNRMLKPGGVLGVRTEIYHPSINFQSWWYARDPVHVVFYQWETFQWIAAQWQAVLTRLTPNVVILHKSIN